MKNLIILLLVLFSSNLLAQKKKTTNKPKPKKQSTIEGIGDFKIHKTKLSIIDSLVSSGYKYTELSTFSDLYALKNKTNFVCLLINDTTKVYQNIQKCQLCNDSKVYYLPAITISNIEINNLYLTFYKGILVKIDSDFSSQILEAFKTKYGESESTEYTKTYNCRIFGNLVPYNETSYYDFWYNKDITATSYFGSYRDSKCDKQYISSLTIESETKMKLLDNCSKLLEDKINLKEKLLNKDKYNKF